MLFLKKHGMRSADFSEVRRIFREAEELGLPTPEIVEVGMRMRFIVPLAEPLTIQARASTEQVTEQVKRILNCLGCEPLGARDAMQQLGLRHRPTFLYGYLQPAMDASLVEMTQPESPKSPTQKYRLTPKGKTVLAVQVRPEELL